MNHKIEKSYNNLQKLVDAIWGRSYTLENRWKNMEYVECEEL